MPLYDGPELLDFVALCAYVFEGALHEFGVAFEEVIKLFLHRQQGVSGFAVHHSFGLSAD